jgi:hypothetical protein
MGRFFHVEIEDRVTPQDLLDMIEEMFKKQFKEQETDCFISKFSLGDRNATAFRFDLPSGKIFSIAIKVDSKDFLPTKLNRDYRRENKLGCTSELTKTKSKGLAYTYYFGSKVVFSIYTINELGTLNFIEKFNWLQPLVYRFEEDQNFDECRLLSKGHHTLTLLNSTYHIVNFVHHIIKRNSQTEGEV